MRQMGRVFLVGAGPGDPELLTVRALRLLQTAEAIVYDRLVSDEILSLVRRDAECIPVGKESKRHPVPQEQINAILVRQAHSGRITVRLKGGDPFVFGRGSEEAEALRLAGIPFEVVPGITAAQGCAASAGVPLTHRGIATGVRYVTGHCRHDLPLDLDWQGLADPQTTLVVYMGLANIAEITTQLMNHGLSGSTPVLAVNNGTTPCEKRLVGELVSITEACERAAFRGPVLFIIGHVVSLYSQIQICPLLQEASCLLPDSIEIAAHA